MRRSLLALSLVAAAGLSATPATAQFGDPAPLIAAQKQAMAPLAMMDGVWRGQAWTILQNGQKHEITQTERIGPLLDGAVKVMEGRGYEADGKTSFNAVAILSYDPGAKTFTLNSHALGRSGNFPLTPTADGYVWTTPAGPNAIVRYTAVIKDGKWREIGEYVMEGQPPRQFFEMNLVWVGDSSWPTAGAIPPK
jgi:hypothetical protein